MPSSIGAPCVTIRPKTIERKVIQTLLDAAVHAPTAMHEEPWSFAVIQDKNVLDRLSESAKKLVHNEAQGSDTDRCKAHAACGGQAGFPCFL